MKLPQKFKPVLSWMLWIFLIQMVLANTSAAIYAYRFTHFYNHPSSYHPSKNIFFKTWKLFVGPRIYKMDADTTTPLNFENIRLSTDDNITIRGWYGKQDTATRCIILLHGITANKTVLLNEANLFRSWGYNVLLIDFRAHGNSGGHKSSFGFKETDELQKAFDLAQLKGNKKIVVYGVSMGAVVAAKAVAEQKIHPDALILDMPFASLQDHLKARARILGFPPQPFAFLVSFWIGAENGYNGLQLKTDCFAKKINCPVFLEWGTDDPYVTVNEMKQVYEAVPSTQKKWVQYANVGHDSFLKNSPVEWQNNMASFLENSGFNKK